MASKFFVVTSGWWPENHELGDHKIVVVEIPEAMIGIPIVVLESGKAQIVQVEPKKLALLLAGYTYPSSATYGPNAWIKATLEEAVSFALYRADYPGSECTCRINVVSQNPDPIWTLLKSDPRFQWTWG